jgi:hypothetical protein
MNSERSVRLLGIISDIVRPSYLVMASLRSVVRSLIKLFRCFSCSARRVSKSAIFSVKRLQVYSREFRSRSSPVACLIHLFLVSTYSNRVFISFCCALIWRYSVLVFCISSTDSGFFCNRLRLLSAKSSTCYTSLPSEFFRAFITASNRFCSSSSPELLNFKWLTLKHCTFE